MSLNRKVTVPLGRAGMRDILPLCVAFLTPHSDGQLVVVCKRAAETRHRPLAHHTTAPYPPHEQTTSYFCYVPLMKVVCFLVDAIFQRDYSVVQNVHILMALCILL